MKKIIAGLTLIIVTFLFSAVAYATAPATKAHIDKLNEEGLLSEATENALSSKDNIMNPHLSKTKMSLDFNGSQAPPQVSVNIGAPLNSIGTQNVLVLLVDFSDRIHTTSQTVAAMESKLFGNGNSDDYPYESLRNFYTRSSYGKLNLQGEVWGWYRAQKKSSDYVAMGLYKGRSAIMKEAIEYYVAQGKDISKFDNDKDGNIEGVYVMYAGNDGDWTSFWWATTYWDCYEYVSNKSISNFVFMGYASGEDNANNIGAAVAIHETGHLLGLPDYYDYNYELPPYGGTGG